ncbi:RING finger and CHY zinc finger domain-containing protein 1 [Chaetoceros tenuissimus]|uniref:RING finger and CHY zinc finger domain-containing protein 1 n=1 Tax=Chaetoceros tenuissimus TaxID=426638 RepID=A0AAD3D6H3_9STRA|nr:RING finger and CHY zinc finger domain-containing protein 1 [Chaetoceros tenuissimus]
MDDDIDMMDVSSRSSTPEADANQPFDQDMNPTSNDSGSNNLDGSDRIMSITESASALPQEQEATQAKRRAIRALMMDRSLDERTRSMRIQQLMDGSNPDTIYNQLQQEQQNELQQQVANGEISQNNAQALQAAVATGATVPCVHYERKCNVVAPCCGKLFGCRVCHDELTNGAHGQMDRFAIREIVCKECNTRQTCSNRCINPQCGITFAEYHCHKCNLWMALANQPFHCDKCGFCRVGGQQHYRHCDQCSMCINANTFDQHNCLRDKYKNNCPVCREDMHTSRHAPQDLPCGHAIHAHCFRRLASYDYRCPVCKKTVVSHRSMAAAWAERASDIDSQPMPNDLARVVDIMCNDCEEKSKNLSWHFLGVQCPKCSSFNTVVEEVINSSTST